MKTQTNEAPSSKNKLKVYIPLISVIILVLVSGWYWYRDYSRYITTDDAYIESDNVSVGSKIMGRIAYEYADEGDSVKAGMLLAVLDSSDLIAQKNQSLALKDQSITTKSQTEAGYNYDMSSIKVLQVNLDRAKEDFTRAKSQYEGEVITKEAYDHSAKAVEAASAQLNAAITALSVSKAKIESSASSIKSAQAQVALIESQLQNTKLYAPMNGIIAKRWLLPGDIATTGRSVFTVTNNEKFWVVVYLEETKIAKIKDGQKAFINIDAFPGVKFYGKVFSISSSTASQFSLIPPSNASGNFTKVTQRVPLKISIEGTKNGDKISSFKFLTGMSVEVKIIKD